VAEGLLDTEKLGGIAKRSWGKAVMKMAQGTPRREAFLQATAEVVPNAGDLNIARMMQVVVDSILAELPSYPTAQDMEKLFTVADWRYLTTQKRLKLSTGGFGVIIPGKGILRGHHVVEKVMIEKHLNARWGFTLDEGESPLKVLVEPQHWDGPNSLHRKMWYEWDPRDGIGKLHESRLNEFDSPEEMMDELLRFYKANYPELANAVRGWCVKNGVPFSE